MLPSHVNKIIPSSSLSKMTTIKIVCNIFILCNEAAKYIKCFKICNNISDITLISDNAKTVNISLTNLSKSPIDKC